MEKINELSVYIQTALLLGLGVRIVYCFIQLQTAEEDAARYKKRIRNGFIIAIIAELIFIIKDVLISYYGGV